MTTVVCSNVSDPRQGGGLPYILAIAAALAGSDRVRILFPAALRLDLARQLFPVPLDGLSLESDLRPSSLLREIVDVAACHGRVIVQATEVPRLRGLRNAHLLCEFPFQRRLGPGSRLRLTLFRSVVANSAFTARWIERRWGRPARVLHPPVFPIPPREKRPWIVAVGRFTGGGRSKRQLEMIEVFRTAHLAGWELHLVGTAQDPEYVRRATEAARGLPVVFHLDASRAELEEVCGAASLFWHFTGVGEDAEAAPERMEHFGIATAEAMSAGAVPVVVARGGQPEIVGDAGALWETLEQCAEATRRLCEDGALRARLCEAARQRAEGFAFPRFAERARELFAA
ncbi:MAG TPA: glycosyltransferase family 4 protein [Thermoanaerobaculia bacterium]|nr:glycosyltransferase family 4 protein [Thermoanaerobaculia bacterium]